MKSASALERDYASVIESESAVFVDLGKFLDENQIIGDLARDIKLCVSEAFNNAAIHGNQLDASKQVRLILSANAHRLVADIIDEGQNGLANIERRRKPTALDESGRGINLIYERADDVNLSTVANGGLSVRLTFNCDQARRNVAHNIGAPPSGGHAPELQEES